MNNASRIRSHKLPLGSIEEMIEETCGGKHCHLLYKGDERAARFQVDIISRKELSLMVNGRLQLRGRLSFCHRAQPCTGRFAKDAVQNSTRQD